MKGLNILVSNKITVKKRSVIFYIVGMWCNANLFAEKERLHCLFTDIIVTEMSEALLYDINTSQEELDRENVKLAERLRLLLDENVMLQDIPSKILAMDDVHLQLILIIATSIIYKTSLKWK